MKTGISLLTYFIVVIFLAACNSEVETNDNNNDNITNEEEFEQVNESCDTIATSSIDNLEYAVLNISTDEEIFNANPYNRWNKQSEAVQNRHNPKQTDTIYTFTQNNSSVKVYKVNSGKAIIFGFDINEEDVNGLNIPKEAVLQTTGEASLNCRQVTFESPEVPSYLTLTFDNNKLVKAHYNGYLD